jgi:hypothetical protein
MDTIQRDNAEYTALFEIREVQKLMRRAEQSPAYSGNWTDEPDENIGPWDRAADAVGKLEQNPKAVEILAEHGFEFEDGCLYGQKDEFRLRGTERSSALDEITASPDLPRAVTVEGRAGQPDKSVAVDVKEISGWFSPTVMVDGQAAMMLGNRAAVYNSKEEPGKMAEVVLRNHIDDNGLKTVEARSAALTHDLGKTPAISQNRVTQADRDIARSQAASSPQSNEVPREATTRRLTQ